MVYNNAYYTPASLADKLRAKFGDRTSAAIFRANSFNKSGADANGEVISFFGRADDSVAGDRAVPSAKRAARVTRDAERTIYSANAKNVNARAARPAQQVSRQNVRPARQNVQNDARNNVQHNKQHNNMKASAPMMSREEYQMRTGAFGKAYAAGDRVKKISSKVRVHSKDRYTKKNVSKEMLARGRADIPRSRRAVVKSDTDAKAKTGFFAKLRESVKDIHKAEHRVRSTPFPIAYAALIVVCAIMSMALLFGHSQVSECEGRIGDLGVRYEELSEETAKLELQLETRDDIRKIENIAVEQMGMVSSDVAQTKFVSVSAEDKVEILRVDEKETEGGFSTLLSAIGEGIGKFGEYFN